MGVQDIPRQARPDLGSPSGRRQSSSSRRNEFWTMPKPGPHLAVSRRRHAAVPSLAMAPPGPNRHDRNTHEPSPLPSSPLSRPRRLRLPVTPVLTTILLVLTVFLRHAEAVLIPFDNCLPPEYTKHEPARLQWVPLYVDAVFDTSDEKYTLKVTTWGNVTGSYSGKELPGADHPDWSNAEKTDGKILREPQPDSANSMATTLLRKVNVLTYQPVTNRTDFCKQSLLNGTCPLGPVFDASALDLPYGLPAMSLFHDFSSSYSFATLSTTFIMIYGDDAGTNIGCVSAPVTPDLGGFAWMLTFLPFGVLVFVGLATVFAAVYSPWGTTDIFMWTSNHGRDVDLLRLVTPGFGDCLQYIQFIVLSGGLTLNYPGFYQPVTSQVAWSTLLFNQSFVSKGPPWQHLEDGIYVTNSTLGLGRLSQLVGISEVQDIWAGMMIWLLVIIGGVLVLTQLGFLVHRLYRLIRSIPEEDLRSKNVPFSLGNIVRIVFNYMLLPIVTFSTFQLVVAGDSPPYTIALAIVTLVIIFSFTGWVFFIIRRARPKSDLFDDLPTVLLYGPLYNTYSDEAAGFALIPIFLAIIRGIAFGAIQASGVAQIAVLASTEVIQLLSLVYFQPFHSQTSMNAYNLSFAIVRLVTTLLMISFAPSLGVTEGPKGWVGYVILFIHGSVLLFGFFLNAIQTLIEVVARLLGAGADDAHGLTRGGLSKIFGMRQLARRRMSRRHGPSRHSQLSTAAMLGADRTSKSGYIMPGGRLRSESAASIGGLMNKQQHRSSSALDSIDMYPGPGGGPGSSFTPTTPGEASPFSFLPSPTHAGRPPPVLTDAVDPYYRPPRRRRGTLTESVTSHANHGSISESKRYSQPAGLTAGDPADLEAALSRGATPAPYGVVPINLAPRTDYTTREVDFYYGVRGPALNSDRPGRKLGTGPADPTGPVATAQGWLRNLISGKTKDKGKGFEVVRSARMPPGMQMHEDGRPPPEGMPVAMSNLRNGPSESDDEGDDDNEGGLKPGKKGPRKANSLLDERGEPRDLEASALGLEAPDIPRKSSKRNSGTDFSSMAPSLNVIPPGSPSKAAPASDGGDRERGGPPVISRLPFERSDSLRHHSSVSSMDVGEDLAQIDLHRMKTSEDRPTSGVVPQHSISRVEPERHHVDLLGSAAELVDDQYASSRAGSTDERA